MSSVSRLLVIMPNNLGDVIMATPVPAAMKARDPGTHITFFVEKGFDEPLVGNPHIDRIFCFDRAGVRDHMIGGRVGEGLALLRRQIDDLCASPFDRVINLCQIDYISRLMPLIPARAYVGRRFLSEGIDAVADPWSRYLYAIPFGRAANRLHASDIYRRIAGVGAVGAPYVLCIDDTERRAAEAFLSAQGMAPGLRPLIFLQPGASVAGKRWPRAHWCTLAAALADAGWGVLVAGSPSEQGDAAAVVAATGGRGVLLAGALTFRESCAVLSYADCCVSGDTAAMHAAAALSVRTVALFGPTSPVETGPYGDGHLILSPATGSRPSFDLSGDTSLSRIPPAAVLRAVVEDRDTGVCGVESYRTVINVRGEYTLLPLAHAVSSGIPWFDAVSAGSSIRVLDDHGDPVDDPAGHEILMRMNEACEIMAAELDGFIERGDGSGLGRMEQKRAEISAETPDALMNFLAALLNLRLNAVPLLDLRAGIGAMRTICRENGATLSDCCAVAEGSGSEV